MTEETVGVIRHSTLPADPEVTLKTTSRLFKGEQPLHLSAKEGTFVDGHPRWFTLEPMDGAWAVLTALLPTSV
jgi:hypothetical protein